MKNEPKEIFFDIDGVITIETEGYSNEEYLARTPNKSVINIINMCYKDPKFKVTLYTARHLCDKEVTEYWLRTHGVKFHELILGKPHYDLLIDDKALKFDNLSVSLILAIQEC